MILHWHKPFIVEVISSRRNGLRQTSLPNLKCKYKLKINVLQHAAQNTWGFNRYSNDLARIKYLVGGFDVDRSFQRFITPTMHWVIFCPIQKMRLQVKP